MGPSTFVRAFVALILVIGALPASAVAQRPAEQFHDHFTDSFPDEICGIAVDVDVVVTDNFFLFADGSVRDTASVQATFTNPDNGQSVVVSNSGLVTDAVPVVDEQAGTITFTTSFKGLPEKIQTANGAVLLGDAGFITIRNTFDLETDEFISGEVLLNNGPHPEADSDFELFCEVITGALT